MLIISAFVTYSGVKVVNPGLFIIAVYAELTAILTLWITHACGKYGR